MPFTGVMGPIPAEPASHGLMSAAAVVVKHSASDSHWVNGLTLETETCNFRLDIWGPCTTGTAANDRVTVLNTITAPRWFDASPYSILMSDTCSTVGSSAEERLKMIERKLEVATPYAIEYELWTGSSATKLSRPTRFLSSSAAVDKTPTPGTAVSPRLGLALLERELGICGAGTKGTIHATRDVATLIADGVADTPLGPQLRTWLGTPIAAGSGYTGTGPSGAAITGTKRWMYATGPVAVHVGAMENYSEAVLTVPTNDITVQAERPAVAYWDGCCHLAVLVDLSVG